MENSMTRRAFGKLSGVAMLVATMGTSILTSGCTSFASILAWVNVGLASFQSVVDLLAGAGVINIVVGSVIDLVIKAVKAALADIATAVNAYNAAPAAQKATLLGKIATALQAAQNEIAQFWNDLTLPDPKIASTVAGLLGLIVATIASFQTLLPPPVTPALTARPGLQSPAGTAPKSVGEFKKRFNAILDANGYAQYKRF